MSFGDNRFKCYLFPNIRGPILIIFIYHHEIRRRDMARRYREEISRGDTAKRYLYLISLSFGAHTNRQYFGGNFGGSFILHVNSTHGVQYF